ncbi:MAG: BrnA antitoxin family protein [Terracidiphilus sp.]
MAEDEIRALKEKPDEDIDYREIPPLQGRQWTTPGALVPAGNKQQITLRLDSDVVAFFRSTGRRYQSRINAVLREYLLSNPRAK